MSPRVALALLSFGLITGVVSAAHAAQPTPAHWGWDTLTVRVLLDVTPGAAVQLTLRDGVTRAGKSLGPGFLSGDEYAIRYAAWRDTVRSDFSFPALGESITVIPRRGAARSGTLLGFSVGEVYVRLTGRAGIYHPTLSSLRALRRANGTQVPGATLVELERYDALPHLNAIRVASFPETTLTATDDVALAMAEANASHGHGSNANGWAGVMVVLMVIAIASGGIWGHPRGSF